MHFDILVEDVSGKEALEVLVPKVIDASNTYRVISYKGIGEIPKDLKTTQDPRKRVLLAQLPKLLNGYGRTYQSYPQDYHAALIFICDLDKKCLKTFRDELYSVLAKCAYKPNVRFCIAVEEGEAWLLGDLTAVKNAYPNARQSVLDSYVNDSICGTWEKLAEAVYPGGLAALSSKGSQLIGKEKSEWAKKITPFMNVESNKSQSFNYLIAKIAELANSSSP